MEPRMKHPVFVVPEAMQALQALGKAVHKTGLSPQLIELVNLRASQINGCSVCVEMHSRSLKAAGESDERIWSVGAWRETPYYDEAERAAFALDGGDHPPLRPWRCRAGRDLGRGCQALR